MRNLVISRNAALFAAGGFAAALFLGGAAHAITDTVFKYATAQTGHLAVSPGAFSPAGRSGSYFNIGDSIQVLDTGAQCFVASVNLPKGARITALASWYVSASAAGTHYLILSSNRMSDGAGSNIKFLAFTNSGGARKGSSAAINPPAAFDPQYYLYHLLYCTENSTDNVFYGARITYTYATAGD